MMEYWNDDFKKMALLYLIPVKKNFTITQLSIFSLSRRLSPPACKPYGLEAEPEAQNPIFQCSNIPTFQL